MLSCISLHLRDFMCPFTARARRESNLTFQILAGHLKIQMDVMDGSWIWFICNQMNLHLIPNEPPFYCSPNEPSCNVSHHIKKTIREWWGKVIYLYQKKMQWEVLKKTIKNSQKGPMKQKSPGSDCTQSPSPSFPRFPVTILGAGG